MDLFYVDLHTTTHTHAHTHKLSERTKLGLSAGRKRLTEGHTPS